MGAIGLGLAALGRPEYINIRENKNIDKTQESFESNSYAVLDAAYKHGVRFFDTAPSYGKGEMFLQKWDKNRNHLDAILSTKWGYTYVANWELGYKGSHEIKEHSLEKLIEQWEQSESLLPRLKFYQIHSATIESGVLDNTEVLGKLFEFKSKFNLQIGLTSSGVNQRKVILKGLGIEKNGIQLFDSYQVTYNVFEQNLFELLFELKEQGKFIIIKEALANGRVFLKSESNELLKTLAEKYNVGVDAISLRYCLDSIPSDIVLSGAANENQLKSNMRALDFELTHEEKYLLKSLKVSPEEYWNERSLLEWD